jgi:nonsense-mediated mRNA decay protein 3
MVSGKFCPSCGKKTDRLVGSLCEECFRKTIKSSEEFPEKISIKTCTGCGKIFIRDSGFLTEEKAIEDFLKRSLKKKEMKSASYRLVGKKLVVNLVSSVSDVENAEEIEINVSFKNILCKYCSLRSSSYFNAIVQVRAGGKNAEIVKSIEDFFGRARKTNNYAFISYMQNLPEGVDIYVGSKSVAEQAIRQVKEKYNITTKVSRKIWGLKEGKKVYRDTILVRLENEKSK